MTNIQTRVKNEALDCFVLFAVFSISQKCTSDINSKSSYSPELLDRAKPMISAYLKNSSGSWDTNSIQTISGQAIEITSAANLRTFEYLMTS